MAREECTMFHVINGEVYCDYYDYGFARCQDVAVCPEGFDEEEYEEDKEYEKYEE
jgi:hypothetical protein